MFLMKLNKLVILLMFLNFVNKCSIFWKYSLRRKQQLFGYINYENYYFYCERCWGGWCLVFLARHKSKVGFC
jgi:hypothetical protein